MSRSNLYDIEAEEETIYILRAQNKKIRDLYEDIDKKEQMIYALQNDTSKYDDYQKQITNYKNQINTQEEKIQTLENTIQESNRNYGEHLKRAADIENILRSQIASKDKILSELNSTIKQYETQMSKIKNELNEKTLTIIKLKTQNDDSTTQIKNFMLKLNLSDEELKNSRNENEKISNEFNQAKIKFEDKTDELVDLIKQQNIELNVCDKNLKKIEKENIQLRMINTNYKKEIESLIENIKQIKENMERFSKIEERVRDSEILISDLQNIIESERNKNSDMQKKLLIANETNTSLLIKCNENENLIELVKFKDEEIKSLLNQIENISNMIKRKDEIMKEIQNEIFSFSNYLNDYFITTTQWVDTYLGVYININLNSKNHFNFEVTDLVFEKLFSENEKNNLNTNSNQKQISSHLTNFIDCSKLNLQFENLSNILMNSRLRINEEFMNYDDALSELKNFNTDLTNANEELKKENSELKKENLELNEFLCKEREAVKKMNLENLSLKEILNNVESEKIENEKVFRICLENLLKEFKDAENLLKNELPYSQNISSNFEFSMKSPKTENLLNIKDQLKDCFQNFLQFGKNNLSDFDSLQKQIEEYKSFKNELEILKIRHESLKKEKSEEIQRILKERNDQISSLEKLKFNELKKKEEEFKKISEKIKVELNLKTEMNEKLKNECDLLKSQMELIENNFEKYKISKKEQE